METDSIWEEETEESDETSNEVPFDPSLIQIYPKPLLLDLMMRRIRQGALDLHPDFQRAAGVWTKTKQSRLIESLLIRIPIPSFYFDASVEDHWLVVDGLQRLSAIHDFISGRLKLVNLEFLHDFEGLTYAQLPPTFQMRIDETELVCYLIMPGTPLRVKFDIFRRINTGGVPLSQQEIRHALNIGPCTDLIKAMAETEEFVLATGGRLSQLRMADRECALRYLVFSDLDPATYSKKDFNLFLCDYMTEFNRKYRGVTMDSPEMRRMIDAFRATMTFAHDVFGDLAFRKVQSLNDSRRAINKALFEAWSVAFAKLDGEWRDRVLARKQRLVECFIDRLNTDALFLKSVSTGTGDVAMVHTRFRVVGELITEAINA